MRLCVFVAVVVALLNLARLQIVSCVSLSLSQFFFCFFSISSLVFVYFSFVCLDDDLSYTRFWRCVRLKMCVNMYIYIHILSTSPYCRRFADSIETFKAWEVSGEGFFPLVFKYGTRKFSHSNESQREKKIEED